MSIFSKVAVPSVHHSNFNLTHQHLTSIQGGYLVPIMCQEVLPGDEFKGSTEAFVRLAPMQFPPLDQLKLKTYTFFCPNRIIWKYWQDFIAESKEDVAPSMLTFIPDTDEDDFTNRAGTLFDYFGLPVADSGFYNVDSLDESESFRVSALPFLAYQKIYNDYFRDENLIDDLFPVDGNLTYEYVNKTGFQGRLVPEEDDLVVLRKKAWQKDYFTSALPDPQYGIPVPVPVTGTASISEGSLFGGKITDILLGSDRGALPGAGPLFVYGNSSGGFVPADHNIGVVNAKQEGVSAWSGGLYTDITAASNSDNAILGLSANSGGIHISSDSNDNLVKLQNMGFTINDLRLASSIQRFQELLARAGHRYKETILSMFNEITPDYRLDRPQFLSSQVIPVVISEVAQTSQTSSNSPQATLAGRGLAFNNGGKYSFKAYEHGWLMTIAVVMPDATYANGLERKWFRKTRYDYFTPAFEELGEQAIYNKEVFLGRSDSVNDATWGYAPRYSEYKTARNYVTGEFRANLNYMSWHRQFSSLPLLNKSFIEVDEATVNRPFAITDSDVAHFYCQFVNHLTARRPMQYNPAPRLI